MRKKGATTRSYGDRTAPAELDRLVRFSMACPGTSVSAEPRGSGDGTERFWPTGSLQDVAEHGGSSSFRGSARRRVRLVLGRRAGAVSGPRRAADPEVEHRRRRIAEERRPRDLGHGAHRRRGRGRCRGGGGRGRPGWRGMARGRARVPNAMDQGLAALLPQPLQLGPGRAEQPIGRRLVAAQPRPLGPQVDVHSRAPVLQLRLLDRLPRLVIAALPARRSRPRRSPAIRSRPRPSPTGRLRGATPAGRPRHPGGAAPAGRPSRFRASARSASVQVQPGPPSSAVERPLPRSVQRPISQSQPAEVRRSWATIALGIVGQPPAQLRRRELLVLLPVGEPGGVHAGVVLDDPLAELLAPPRAQGHLADQLAFDRVAGPEVAGESGLAAIDLRRRVRRQDDPGAGEPVLAAVPRLRALPSGEIGPRDSRPLARLASARAVRVLVSVVVTTSRARRARRSSAAPLEVQQGYAILRALSSPQSVRRPPRRFMSA